MKVRILGSAAGGGFPQWNCNCVNCAGARTGAVLTKPRTQSSIALSSTGDDWVLVNASPDLNQQLCSFEGARATRALRDTAISDIVLVDAQLDHTLGLLSLREHRQPLRVWCTDQVYADLTRENPILPVLQHYCGVDWRPLPPPGAEFQLPGLPGTRCSLQAAGGNAPPFSSRRDAPAPGDNIALSFTVEDSGRTLVYAPAVGVLTEELKAFLGGAHTLLIEGTFWTDDELIRLGVSERSSRAMGHIPLCGENGLLELLGQLLAERKVLVHVNNTNPILDERSTERLRLERAGIEVAEDGMELVL